jgi:hypothetical protein
MGSIDQLLSNELNLDNNLSNRLEQNLSRLETRRTVEDLWEVRRYKKMLEDYYDIE